MAKIGGMFFDEGQSVEEIEFSFDKFIDEIVDNEKKAKEKKAEANKIEEADERKYLQRYTERAGNRIRYGKKK